MNNELTINNRISEVLSTFAPTTLEEMKKVRLMNRTDTKYITTVPNLMRLLEMAEDKYMVQETGGECLLPYYTLYFDTPECNMYMVHLHGKKTRQKIRIRQYEQSGLAFIEVKNKNNKGRTSKKRIQCECHEIGPYTEFLDKHSAYPTERLLPRLENRFRRITLVNKDMTERLTIDTSLRFHSFRTDKALSLDDFVIIELKRDGRTKSPLIGILNELRIHESGFSKYCMGMALTDDGLPANRFKERLRKVRKMVTVRPEYNFYKT